MSTAPASAFDVPATEPMHDAAPLSAAPWHGHVFLGVGFAIYDGPVTATGSHAHHAAQIVLCHEGELILESDGRRAHGRGFVVPPDHGHAIALGCERATMIYVEPESHLGVRLLSESGERSADGDPASWARRADVLSDFRFAPLRTWSAALALIDLLASRVPGPAPTRRPIPPPIDALLRFLPNVLGAPIRLHAVATQLGLSESRLGHLVRAHLGISFRRFVLWSRLRAATEALARASTVTDAAHAAGFADAAHMSRVFRRMMGVTPSAVMRSAVWHVAPPHRDLPP